MLHCVENRSYFGGIAVHLYQTGTRSGVNEPSYRRALAPSDLLRMLSLRTGIPRGLSLSLGDGDKNDIKRPQKSKRSLTERPHFCAFVISRTFGLIKQPS
jgi:hypothetical protein